MGTRFLVAVSLALFIHLTLSKKWTPLEARYDEYQQVLKGQSYKFALWGIVGILVGFLFIQNTLSMSLSTKELAYVVLYVAFSLFFAHSLWTGAYFPLNKETGLTPKSFLLASVLLMLTSAFRYQDFSYLLIALFSLQNLLIMGLRTLWKKEEADG